MADPAYRIHTRRLVIRCWEPKDAPLLKAALDASIEHLLPWMPWATQEPQEVAEKVQRIRRWRGNFDLDQDYTYAIFDEQDARVVGGCGLHTRGGTARNLEIGYWIHKDFVQQGLATETAAALTRVAFEVNQVGRIEIHCDPANLGSAAVPRKLGYMHEATLRKRLANSQGELRDEMVWTLLAEEYPSSPAASSPLEAFDAFGARLL
jgi:RimJ/RimL family protein N-acetyltransferase